MNGDSVLGPAMILIRSACWALVLFAGSLQMAAAEDAATLYQRKTVRIVVGASAGGGFDTYARIVENIYKTPPNDVARLRTILDSTAR